MIMLVIVFVGSDRQCLVVDFLHLYMRGIFPNLNGAVYYIAQLDLIMHVLDYIHLIPKFRE